MTDGVRRSILGNATIVPIDRKVTLEVMLLISDPCALLELASTLRCECHPFWMEAMSTPRPPFTLGDRDDQAAERLYELAKLAFA